MEEGIAELRCLSEKFGGFCWVICDELLHLNEDVEELSWRKSVESTGDRVSAGQTLKEIYAWWKLE